MRSFRQKVILSYLILLLVFLGLMFPSVTNSVQRIVFRSMSDYADTLIAELNVARNDEELVQILKDQRSQQFYRVGVLDSQRRLLYDSHTKRLLGTPFFPLQFVTQPEVEDALQNGIGYAEEYSHLLGQKLVYLAKRFDFHGQPYVIRLAFPFQYIQDLRDGLTVGFLFFGSLVLILFSALASLVLNHFSSPIRTITGAIRDYKEGNLDSLPYVRLKLSPQDEFSRLANTLNSLSHRVRLEIESVTRERNEREAILESLSEGVVAVDSSFKVSYANRKALTFLGLHHDVIGRPLPPELNPKYQRLLEQCHQQKLLMVDEVEVRRANDSQYFNIVATPRDFGRGALLVLHDTSVEHRMLEMRKAFIANASHELKTPITVIRGFAETLHDNSELPQETVEEVTSRIVASCQRMTSIIKNLLTLADIENLPSFRVASHNLLDLAQACSATVQAIRPDAAISIHCDVPEPCLAEVDSSLIEMAITNLLDNGVKYSEGPAHIDVRLRKEQNGMVIDVQDQGIGIPEADLGHIFQRFYRVNKAHSTKLGGSGLGLSIVETIINKHLGKIEVRSALGQGSTFSIFLPSNLGERLRALEEASRA
jgi:two-component system, OmpR family, phosphate regulon sensor histidine kinase PhoR